ncbi:hypothetical protein [Rhodococcus erythropolis]|uniref:hypothetical protein n=1 Tax=Rhodococcus erythropolis TaxID=1833 RepID=UPI00367064C7
MTTPGIGAPDGAFVVGSRYGQDVPNTEAGVIALVKGQNTGPWQVAQDKFRTSIQGPMQQQQAELAGLQSRTQKLEGVIGYAHAYATGGISMSLGSVKYSMSNQIGPVVGATMTNGGFVLGSKGLWVADAHMSYDYYTIPFGVTKVSLSIRVYAPNGSLHAIRTARDDSDQDGTLTVHMPFTIPSAGYTVEMWINAALGRGVFGGSEWNGLSVSKISTETN